MDKMRIDKWLWVARFFKTRQIAQDHIALGRVLLDGQRMKASREIKVGDKLCVERSDEKFNLTIRALAPTRGSATVAQTLYEETEESVLERVRLKEIKKIMLEPSQTIEKGRPTKKNARLLKAFREQ